MIMDFDGFSFLPLKKIYPCIFLCYDKNRDVKIYRGGGVWDKGMYVYLLREGKDEGNEYIMKAKESDPTNEKKNNRIPRKN